MIKFFRKIRKKLLTENKFGKYLLYATGEIILVVIGILIALQINTWNQNSMNKQTEIKYLESIKFDLIEQNNILSGLINDQDKYKYNAEKALNLMISETYHNRLDSLYSFLLGCTSTRTFSIIGATYEDLNSTGNFQLIKNEKLKQQIIKMYTLLYEEDKISAKNNPIVEEYFGNYIRQNQLGFYYDKNGMIFNENFKDPKVVFTLINLLKTRSNFAQNRIDKMINIQKELTMLIDAINIKIKSK